MIKKSKNWEWINSFQSNIKDFMGINKLAEKNNNTHRNVSAFFKAGNSSEINLQLIADDFEMIDSTHLDALMTFVCKKSKTKPIF